MNKAKPTPTRWGRRNYIAWLSQKAESPLLL